MNLILIFRTAIHYAAAYNGNIEVIKFLVDHGADLEAEDHYGR